MDYYRKVKNYFEQNGKSNISQDYVADDGKRLGVWITSQRYAYSTSYRKKKIKLLEDIGLILKIRKFSSTSEHNEISEIHSAQKKIVVAISSVPTAAQA